MLAGPSRLRNSERRLDLPKVGEQESDRDETGQVWETPVLSLQRLRLWSRNTGSGH